MVWRPRERAGEEDQKQIRGVRKAVRDKLLGETAAGGRGKRGRGRQGRLVRKGRKGSKGLQGMGSREGEGQQGMSSQGGKELKARDGR